MEFRLCAETGRIVRFTNGSVSKKCYGKNAPLYDRPTKPTWSKEKATEVAKKFVGALLGSFPANLGDADATFEHPIMELPKYYVGQWDVRFNRKDKRGHTFTDDGVVVLMLEEYGAYGIGVHLESEYNENEPIRISEKEAIELSKPFAQKMRDWKPIRNRFRHYEYSGEPAARMHIINPNHILNLKSIEALADAGDRRARLAWEIRRPLVYKGPKFPDNLVPVDGDVRVWIDAATGEFLGGDFKY